MITYYDILKIIKNKNVELRHDVDISLISAYKMALIEKKMGVKSIYYLRFDSDYYNILSKPNKKIIDFLVSNHEIGCHVDATNIVNEKELLDYLEGYNEILNFKKFTFHINSEKTKSFGSVGEFVNKSILNKHYVSDSRCEFNEEKIKILNNLEDYTLLVHPEWWDNKKLKIDETQKEKKLKKCLRLNTLYNNALKEILL